MYLSLSPVLCYMYAVADRSHKTDKQRSSAKGARINGKGHRRVPFLSFLKDLRYAHLLNAKKGRRNVD